MERRWGQRLPLGELVDLSVGTQTIRGYLRDVSLSGAFLQTPELLPYMGRVCMHLRHSWVSADVEAYAARACDEGIGLEWCDFAPEPIVALMEWQQHAHFPKAS